MRLQNITAKPHPSGNRIDLKWVNPHPDEYPRVRVMRREGTHPISPEDGFWVQERNALLFSLDPAYANELDVQTFSLPLRQEFLDKQVSLSNYATVTVEEPGSKWQITDREYQYLVRKNSAIPNLNVYGIVAPEGSVSLFDLDSTFASELDTRILSLQLRQKFLDNRISLSNYATVTVEEPRSKWQISDQAYKYFVRKKGSLLNVYDSGLTSASDQNLKGGTVYYYTLFLFRGDPREYKFAVQNRVSAMATAPYNLAGQMMELLPAIYHRYDTVLPQPLFAEEMSEEDKQRGQLHRFLDLPSGQFDQLYSFAKALQNLYDLSKVDGILLPLLAQWIGWDTDFTLEVAEQRNEIQNAPAWYKTIGIIPTVEATVKRISGWESRTKEFVHNVFLSNHPERLNLWERQRIGSGAWSQTTAPLSLNFAYEGRPTAVRDNDGTLWLFYQTLRKDQWNIWYKTYREDREPKWAPSQPLTNRVQLDKHPTAAVQGNTLWVFWDAYDETEKRSHIHYRTQTEGSWSTIEPNEPFANTTNERKTPCAVADNTGGLWLFWLEKVGPHWQLKYNRHDGTAWGSVVSFPLDGVDDPRVQSAPFVLFHPTDATHRLWVFWARKEPTDQTCWQIAYRVKQNIDPNVTADWDAIQLLPKATSEYDDLEPAALVNTAGDVELFWSSNQSGSWSIWSKLGDLNTNNRENVEQITGNPYSQRDPLPFVIGDKTLLIYRANESLTYTSNVYRATETIDFRYAGSTTANALNTSEIALRGSFDDFQTYTYDTQKTNDDWYARDTIGVYLTPDIIDEEKIEVGLSRIKNVLRKFIPITDRAVFMT